MEWRTWTMWSSNEGTKTPPLGLVLGFWIVSNVLVVAWWWADISDRFVPGVLQYGQIAFIVFAAIAPLVLLYRGRRVFLDPVVLGLLVSCCLALSVTAHEANLLRDQTQYSLDREIQFGRSNAVEGLIRPLIARITETYVEILGDDHTEGGSGFYTHIVINYMFDSLSFLAVFALATLLLSPISAWLCLITFAFYAQMAIYPGRVGALFIAGGLFWQLFLLASRRYPAAIISGLIISFGRADIVFASTFALIGIAAFERRWPTLIEACVLALLIIFSLLVPQMLIWMRPDADFSSFLVTDGDFSKLVGNLKGMKLVVAIASPVLAIAIVRLAPLTRTTAVVVPTALIHVGLVLLIADFSETRLVIPALGGLAFVASEALGNLLERKGDVQAGSN
ncbi:hypothetical protein [Bradyrhizobium sp. 5.13L]